MSTSDREKLYLLATLIAVSGACLFGMRTNNTHALIQLSGELLKHAITLVFSRLQSEQQEQYKKEALLRAQMSELYHQGNSFLVVEGGAEDKGTHSIPVCEEKRLVYALNAFSGARNAFDKLALDDASTDSINLYANCCYKEALVLYHLCRYDEAQALIELTLAHNAITNTVVQADLYNLSGLITLIDYYLSAFKGFDQTARSALWEHAKKLFLISYTINSNQTNVLMFLQYLNGNSDYLCQNAPLAFFHNNQHHISLQIDVHDILGAFIVFISAESFLKENKCKEAAVCYEAYLKTMPQSPHANAFFNMAVVRLRCLFAYHEMSRTYDPDIEARANEIIQVVKCYLSNRLNTSECEKAMSDSAYNTLVRISWPFINQEYNSFFASKTQLPVRKVQIPQPHKKEKKPSVFEFFIHHCKNNAISLAKVGVGGAFAYVAGVVVKNKMSEIRAGV